MDNLALTLEAERRGILPADKQAILDEARKRGLVPSTKPSPPLYLGPGGRALTPEESQALNNKPVTPDQTGFLEDPVGYAAQSVGKLAGAFGASPATQQSIGENISGMMEPETLMGIPGAGPVGVGLEGLAMAPTAVGRALSETPVAVQNATDIGVRLPTAIASQSEAVRGTARILQDLPWVGSELKRGVANTAEDLGTAFKGAQAEYGAPSVASAGAGAKASINNYIRGISPAAITAKYAKVDELVSPEVASPLTQTKRVATNIGNERASGALGPSNAVRFVQEGLGRDGMTYEGIKRLRTGLSDMLDTGALPADWSGAEVSRLRDALTSDLKTVIVKSGGAKALSAWEEANSYTASVKARNANLAKILGVGGNASEEAIIGKLAGAASTKDRANGLLLMQARDAIGKEGWGDVASAILERSSTKGGAFDQNTFLRFWENGISPVGKNLLFNSFGRQGVTTSLDKIASTIKEIQGYNAGANTSRTAHASAMLRAGKMLAGAAVGAVAFKEPFSAFVGAVGGKVAAHILARPATAKATADWLRSYKFALRYGTKGATNMLLRSSQALSLAISREFKTPQLVPRLTQEIQGIVPGQAQQNQPQAPGIGQQIPNSPPGQ